MNTELRCELPAHQSVITVNLEETTDRPMTNVMLTDMHARVSGSSLKAKLRIAYAKDNINLIKEYKLNFLGLRTCPRQYLRNDSTTDLRRQHGDLC